MTRHAAGWRSHCPISFALDVIGDRWTLLILRDLLIEGKTTYGEIQSSEERIATNLLADRLAWLEHQGIVRKRRDPQERRRVIYRVTQKGRDLLPVMLEMIRWSAKYDPATAAPSPFVKRIAADRDGVLRDLAAGPLRRA